MRPLALAIATLLAGSPALAGGPLPGTLPVDGPRTQVVNLGSVHLSGFKDWSLPLLDPLLDKLTAFRPDVVTIENIAGEQCEMIRANPKRYEDVADSYCWDPATIRGSTNLSVVDALEAVRSTLADWPASPTAAQRRRLAMLFAASGELPSARVQWLRLSPEERHAGDGLTQPMIDALLRKGKPMNESYDIAAVVAARAGLDRVFLVDDHSSDGVFAGIGEGYGQAMGRHFSSGRNSPVYLRYKAETDAIKDGRGLLDYYRKANAPGAQLDQVTGDFGAAMGQQTPDHYGRMYLGWWEVRNLRMVANIRESFVTRPGARVLNIVGASHKPWYDALLGQMADVTVVDAASVLR